MPFTPFPSSSKSSRKALRSKSVPAPGPNAPGFPVDTPAKQPTKKSSLKQSPKR